MSVTWLHQKKDLKTVPLRFVLLDYPKLILDNQTASLVFADYIRLKQTNYDRTSDKYICMDKLDMISTHFLIYNTQNLFHPRIVAGLRLCYEERSDQFGLSLPVETYIGKTDALAQKYFEKFHRKNEMLVDCNGLFVEEDHSFSRTGLPLAEILFFYACVYILRLGKDHFVAAPNERLKTGRWVKKAGDYKEGFRFIHPSVPEPHSLALVDSFKKDWLATCLTDYAHFSAAMTELIPEQVPAKSFREVAAQISGTAHPSGRKAS